MAGASRLIPSSSHATHKLLEVSTFQNVLKKGTKATVSKYQERTKGNIWEYFVKCVSLTITSGIFGQLSTVVTPNSDHLRPQSNFARFLCFPSKQWSGNFLNPLKSRRVQVSQRDLQLVLWVRVQQAGNLEVWAQILQSQVAAGIKCFYKCHVWLGLKIGRTFQMSQLNNKGCSKTSLGLNPSSFKARQAQILNISHFQM